MARDCDRHIVGCLEQDGRQHRFRRAYREDSDLALRVLSAGYGLVRGTRETAHPLGADRARTALRRQAGNRDDVLMWALHGRGWLTLTGATGGRPPPPDREPPPPGREPEPAAFDGEAFEGEAFEPLDLAAGFAPAAGRPEGRRPPPVCGLLMLIGPRRDRYG